jgi:hypothetical protein
MDGLVLDPQVFERERLEIMFSKLILALEMTPLDKAMFYEVPVDPSVLERVKRTGTFEDEGGTSMLQVISTSHISIHTWPLQGKFSLDAFSCKAFNAQLAIAIIGESLGVTASNTTVFERQWPESGQRLTHYFEI